MSNPIPVKHRPEFFRYMQVADNYHDKPNDWALLDAAEEFMIAKKFERGNPFDALQQYKKMKHDPHYRLGNNNTQQGEPI